MSEHLHYPHPRDSVLHAMALAGWGRASSGAQEHVLGYSALVINEPEELYDISRAFYEPILASGIHPELLVGNYVLGVVGAVLDVTAYRTSAEAERAYGGVRELFEAMG